MSPNPVQKGPKEPIPEEQELDFQGLEEEEEEPPEGLDEGGPEAGEPVGWGGEKGERLEPGQVGRGALSRCCWVVGGTEQARAWPVPERWGGSSQSGVIKVIRANPLENLKNTALVGLGALGCEVDTCMCVQC